MTVELADPLFVKKVGGTHSEVGPDADTVVWADINVVVARFHRLPQRSDPFEAIQFDETGLPR
jgi:hypothetical protein